MSQFHTKGKGKVYHATKRAWADAQLRLLGLEPVSGEPLMSVTRGQCDALAHWLPSQSQGITAHWLLPNYTAW